jgi:thioredoxin reductase
MLADMNLVGKVGGMDTEWDCVVVGGGAAGLSAALVLGRARRRALVVDAGGQSSLAALLADEFGLPVPQWPMEREDADAHA